MFPMNYDQEQAINLVSLPTDWKEWFTNEKDVSKEDWMTEKLNDG